MNCPAPEHLLAYAEGAALPDVATHVATCANCRKQLAELGAFETLLASQAVAPAAERERLRSATWRLLQGGPARSTAPVRRFPVWPALGVAALAAAVLAALTLWPAAHGLTNLGVHSYPVEGGLRAEAGLRFAMTLRVADPRWVAIWELGAGTGKRLLPDASAPLPTYGVTFPLPAGDHRIPAAELLDFDVAPNTAPQQLLVIATPEPLRADQLAAIDALVGKGDQAAFWPQLSQQFPEARLLAFPSR